MNRRHATPATALLELDEIAERLGRVLELSTADTTELAWVESRSARAATGGEPPVEEPVRRSVLIRVREGARLGAYQTGSGEPSEILFGVRQAVAASRGEEPLPAGSSWPEENDLAAEAVRAAEPPPEALWDPPLAALDPATATELLGDLPPGRPGSREHLELGWSMLRVVVRSSDGLDRRAQTTAATLRARSDGGWASGSGRTLERLDAAGIVARARERAAPAGAPEAPGAAAPATPAVAGTEGPILFSPEAAAALVRLLVRAAFPSSAFDYGRSPLSGLLGEHVFAPGIDLVDDGLDPSGLPFPFDMLGRSRRRIELVSDGVPRTPAIDEHLAARLKRPPTPHALGPSEARPIHPFLLPRESAQEVLAAAEGGIWIADLADLECFDRGRVAVRGRTLGARRLAGGRLAEPIEPMVWEDSLLRLFSKVRALGGEPTVLTEAGGMGGVSAPMVCVAGAERLVPRGSA